MPSPSALVVFAGAAFVLLIIPGPAVLYIVTRGASRGRRAALVSVAGIHAGTLVHVLAAVIGLSAIVVASATVFTAVKLAGAAYLVYLGVTTLARRGRADPAIGTGPSDASMGKVFADGVIVNVLNPKTAVFFLAFVPQFIDRDAGNATTQLLALAAVFVLIGLISDGLYAFASGWVGQRLRASTSLERRKDIAAGSIYIALGLATAASAPSPRPSG